MPSYSSHECQKEWRFAIESDFKKPNGSPFDYAPDGKRQWGDEEIKLKFDHPVSNITVSHDRKYIAILVKQTIHVYVDSFKLITILRTEFPVIGSLFFLPNNSDILVVSSTPGPIRYGEPTNPSDGPRITFWSIDKTRRDPPPDEDFARSLAAESAQHVKSRMDGVWHNGGLGQGIADDLATDLLPSIQKAISREYTHRQGRKTIKGSLLGSFGSHPFSHSGKYLIYLPRGERRFNDDDKFDFVVFDMEKEKNAFTCVGHRDGIMWTGFSPDDILIGSVCWDGTSRIWDAASGREKYKFEAQGQHWRGAFSPNGKLFANTVGNGHIFVHSLEDGSTLFDHDIGQHWTRSLSWSADSQFLAYAAEYKGTVGILSIPEQGLIQERILSMDRMTGKGADVCKSAAASMIAAYKVQFLEGGRKLAMYTMCDASGEVYDLKEHVKWRFARTGTDSYPEDGRVEMEADREEAEKERDYTGGSVHTWEDAGKGRIMIAARNGYSVRVWSLPLSAA